MSSSSIGGIPNLEALETLFRLMSEHGGTSFSNGDMLIERDPGQQPARSIASELVSAVSAESGAPDMPLPTNPYDSPLSYGANEVPFFPERGSLIKKDPSSEE